MPRLYRHSDVSGSELRLRTSRATTAGRALPGRKTTRRPRYLFDDWTRVAASLREAHQVILFLDFDGTLVPLEDDPKLVRLDDPTRATLRRLARRLPVIVISGRRAADVQKRVGVSGIEYLGLHGSERAKGPSPQKRGAKPAIRRAPQDGHLIGRVRLLLRERLGAMPSIRIEDKGPIFAVHYRGADRDAVRRAEAALREVLQPFRAQLRLAPSKSAWEVMPKDFGDKGGAVQKVLSRFPQGALPLYAGDDVSDESAFAVLDRGLTVAVGRRSRTKARYYVCNPADVERLLMRLEAALS